MGNHAAHIEGPDALDLAPLAGIRRRGPEPDALVADQLVEIVGLEDASRRHRDGVAKRRHGSHPKGIIAEVRDARIEGWVEESAGPPHPGEHVEIMLDFRAQAQFEIFFDDTIDKALNETELGIGQRNAAHPSHCPLPQCWDKTLTCLFVGIINYSLKYFTAPRNLFTIEINYDARIIFHYCRCARAETAERGTQSQSAKATDATSEIAQATFTIRLARGSRRRRVSDVPARSQAAAAIVRIAASTASFARASSSRRPRISTKPEKSAAMAA